MAFTLQIKQKKLFGKTKLDISALAHSCGFKYGANDNFFVLQEGQINQETAVFYNPARIGRGIFFDGAKGENGLYEISYNIPTTGGEIADFVSLVKEAERRLGKVEMYCVEEERTFTIEELEQNMDNFVKFSLDSLKQFCNNKEFQSHILTLALWPYTLPAEKVSAWGACTDLADFEQTLHDLQARDVYYAKPRLMQKSGTGDIGAFYVLTEECESVFPVRADGFLNLNQIKISGGFIQFYIYSEDRVLDGMYSYERFIKEIERRGVWQFDADHVLVPSMNKEEMEKLADQLRETDEIANKDMGGT